MARQSAWRTTEMADQSTPRNNHAKTPPSTTGLAMPSSAGLPIHRNNPALASPRIKGYSVRRSEPKPRGDFDSSGTVSTSASLGRSLSVAQLYRAWISSFLAPIFCLVIWLHENRQRQDRHERGGRSRRDSNHPGRRGPPGLE